MDKSERVYHLIGEASKIIYDLGLNGWATELEFENKNTGEVVEVRVKIDIKKETKK